jgi:hypothetical protein
LKMKRGKTNFRAMVWQCFSREIITVERVRLFSQRARAYMLAYQMLREEEQGSHWLTWTWKTPHVLWMLRRSW